MKTDKPWGYEILWAHTDDYVGKVLFIKHGHKLSLQYHEKKEETLYVQDGTLTLQVGPTKQDLEFVDLEPGDSYHIQPRLIHRMIANKGDVKLFEVSTSHLKDIVRLADDYGRT